jgi:hypothetical protein
MERDDDEVYSNQYEFAKDGSFILRDHRGHMLISTRCPAILFDRKSGTLHKHGDFDRIRKIAADMRSKYIRVGDQASADCLTIYASKKFDIRELNRCLNITGYCKTLWERLSRQ